MGRGIWANRIMIIIITEIAPRLTEGIKQNERRNEIYESDHKCNREL